MSEGFDAKHIGQCGINCKTCIAYFGYTMAGTKRKHPCKGCKTRPSSCAFIKQKCKKLANKEHVDYCFECQYFPCETLTTIDSTYREKYGLNLIENLKYIKNNGMDDFLKNEQQKWRCPTCNGVISVHTKRCYTCNP